MEATEQTETTLKPSVTTYLRLAGVVAADVITVASMFSTFDWWLALALSLVIVAVTLAAAWYNNSLTKGAIAADAMKDAFTDAANAEEIKTTWKALNDTLHDVYNALKAEKSNG